MKVEFIGTRGNIESKNDRHRRHTSAVVSYYGRRVMIDAGENWKGRVADQNPDAIVITHAHPDHCFALEEGAPCVVWATEESWEDMEDFPIEEREVMPKREPTEIEGILFEAFPVEHSVNAPAVGYRITAGDARIFYVPDLVYIHERSEALADVDVYIGDGASIDQSLVRRHDEDTLIGHTPFRTQLTWCQKEGVPRAIVTHCGSQIVEGDERKLMAKLREYAEERGGVDVQIAQDGMEEIIR